jgi:hypothetical protein
MFEKILLATSRGFGFGIGMTISFRLLNMLNNNTSKKIDFKFKK